MHYIHHRCNFSQLLFSLSRGSSKVGSLLQSHLTFYLLMLVLNFQETCFSGHLRPQVALSFPPFPILRFQNLVESLCSPMALYSWIISPVSLWFPSSSFRFLFLCLVYLRNSAPSNIQTLAKFVNTSNPEFLIPDIGKNSISDSVDLPWIWMASNVHEGCNGICHIGYSYPPFMSFARLYLDIAVMINMMCQLDWVLGCPNV